MIQISLTLASQEFVFPLINTQVTQMFANNQEDAENQQLGYTLFYERFLPKALDVLET